MPVLFYFYFFSDWKWKHTRGHQCSFYFQAEDREEDTDVTATDNYQIWNTCIQASGMMVDRMCNQEGRTSPSVWPRVSSVLPVVYLEHLFDEGERTGVKAIPETVNIWAARDSLGDYLMPQQISSYMYFSRMALKRHM